MDKAIFTIFMDTARCREKFFQKWLGPCKEFWLALVLLAVDVVFPLSEDVLWLSLLVKNCLFQMKSLAYTS